MSKDRTSAPWSEGVKCADLVSVIGLKKWAASVSGRGLRTERLMDQISEAAQPFWIAWLLEALEAQLFVPTPRKLEPERGIESR